MAYFVFNPQTNSLDDSDHPTPIRKNLGEKLLAKNDNIYPWGTDKNPPWYYINRDPWDPEEHLRFLEDFDIRNETMHADGGRVGFQDGTEPKNIKFWKSMGDTQVKKIKAEILKLIGKDPWFIVNKKDLTTKFKANVDKVDRAIAELLGEGRDIKFYDIGEGFDFDQKIKDTYRKNYKIKSLSQMASEMTGKTGYSKEWRKIYAQLMRYRDALMRHGFIKLGDTQRIMESSGEYKGAARTAYNWKGYRNKQLELMKKHPDIDVSKYKDSKGRISPKIFDRELEKFLRIKEIRGGLDARLQPTRTAKGSPIWPSFEHTQGVTPGKILDDPKSLRRVGVTTQKWNWDLLGHKDKAKVWNNLKGYLKSAKRALQLKDVPKANEMIGMVNSIYDNVQQKFKPIKRNELPFYKIKDGKIVETNLKEVIKPQTLHKVWESFLRNAAASLNKTELDKVKRIQPSLGNTVQLFKDGKDSQAIKLIKTRLKPINTGQLFSFAGFADPTMIKELIPKIELSPQLTKVFSKAGAALKVLGHAATPAMTIPFSQQIERGMGKRFVDTGAMRLAEDFVNMPKHIVQLAGMLMKKDLDLPYEATFGRKYADWVASGMSEEEIIENIKKLAIDPKYRDAELYGASGEADMVGDVDVEKLKERAKTSLLPKEEETETITFDRFNVAQGGIIPRIGYRDGPTLGDARGWEKMLDLSDPDVVAKLEAKKVMDEQKDAEYREQAHDKRLLHRTDDYYTSQEESFIPHYVKDVAKTTFGTQEGRQYFGSKLLEGAVEGTEWLVMQIPHLMKQVNPVGLMKLQKEMEEGNFSWMDLLYEPKLGEKWGMNKYQQQKLEELREQAIAEGKPGIPQGVETLGTTGELGAMFADPFMMYAGYRKAAPWIKGSHARLKKAKAEEQVDMGRRDTMKVLGGGGLMIALAKIFPGIFKGGKAKVASKLAKTNYVKQFGNVRGMPDWFPSFMLKATQKGKLKSLPDKDYIYGTVYEVMLPVKKRLGKGKIKTEQVPVSVEVNPNTGTMTVRWTGTDNFGDDIERSINYKPGETGTQNYAADEYGRGTSKEEVVIQDPEFEYVEPDYTSMGPEDTSPDSAMSLDIYDEADEIVEAMEEFVKGADDKFKKKAADEFRLYNQTDEHLGDATGHQTSDGDWVSGDDNMPFPDYDKKTKDVYHRSEFDKSLDTKRKKKAMGGVASGPPPLSGPVPQGLPSLQPGDIYNEWIR